jgi:hypothetical protein
MSLQGLPDFQKPIHGFRYEIFHPYENAGSYVVASTALEIAAAKDGRPDFLLEFVRGISPAMPPAPYALLDFRLRATYPAQDALRSLRERHRAATVTPPVLSGGFLRLRPTATTGDVPAELLEPIRLSANGLGTARCVLRIGPAAGAVIEGALKGEVLGMVAWAEMEMQGVAPRVPARVTFSPAELLNRLKEIAADPSAPVLTRDQVAEFFEQDATRLPLRIDTSVPDTIRRDFAETLADHLRVYYGEFVPSREIPVKASIALRMSEAVNGVVSWDLSQPVAVRRALVASLDPFDAARRIVSADGIAAVVKHTVVPPLAAGTRRVHVAANLPAVRTGVVALGVDIVAPARPPHRPQAVRQTVELVAPADSAVATLRLSATEPTSFTYTPWAVVERSGAVERLDATPVPHQGESLDLGVADFPVRFASVGATPALLDLAAIAGIWMGRTQAGPFERRFELSPESPEIGIAVPADADGESLRIEANERGGSNVLRLTLPAPPSTQLDLPSFAEFGSHRVIVESEFVGAIGLIAVDLVPEGREEQADAIATIALTAAAPVKEWRYTALSPFRSGFRYRKHAGDGAPVEPWSHVQRPDVPLRIGASALAGRAD